jgi:hypothetical protein
VVCGGEGEGEGEGEGGEEGGEEEGEEGGEEEGEGYFNTSSTRGANDEQRGSLGKRALQVASAILEARKKWLWYFSFDDHKKAVAMYESNKSKTEAELKALKK